MKPEKKYKWHKIAEEISELKFKENDLAEVEVAGKIICIARKSDSIEACTSKCPHAGGRMSEGFLNKNGDIVCPVHRYIFSFTNGRDINGEGYYLKIYPVKMNEDGIFIGMEDGGLFSWLK